MGIVLKKLSYQENNERKNKIEMETTLTSFKTLLRDFGYSEKDISEICRWYGFSEKAN